MIILDFSSQPYVDIIPLGLEARFHFSSERAGLITKEPKGPNYSFTYYVNMQTVEYPLGTKLSSDEQDVLFLKFFSGLASFIDEYYQKYGLFFEDGFHFNDKANYSPDPRKENSGVIFCIPTHPHFNQVDILKIKEKDDTGFF